jgi:hypothetical protein
MARRRDNLLDLLVTMPWWVSVLASAGAYAFVAYVAPGILGPHHRLLGPLAQQLPTLAPIAALIFLVPAPLSALRAWRDRRLLDSQTSRKGRTPGTRFWGCSAYPACRGTAAV